MREQQIVACQVLGLRQWTEYRLQQGSLRSKLGANETKAIQLPGQVWNCWVEAWQIFPIPRLVDDAPGITASPFGIADPFIRHPPVPGTKRRGGSNLYQVKVIGVLEV